MLQRKTVLIVFLSLGILSVARAQWKPAKGPLMTRWAKDVSTILPHPEHPSPQMVRKAWLNLKLISRRCEFPESEQAIAQMPATPRQEQGVLYPLGLDQPLSRQLACPAMLGAHVVEYHHQPQCLAELGCLASLLAQLASSGNGCFHFWGEMAEAY